MARLKNLREIRWAGVEFQPNLLRPTTPVRLGAVLLEKKSPISWGVSVIGRTPVPQSRPAEFADTGDLMMKIASGWVNNMFKDILEADHGNIFDFLAQRWRYNLYLIEPKELKAIDARGPLVAISKKLYERFVGESYTEKPVQPSKPKRRAPKDRVQKAPIREPRRAEAWLREKIDRETFGQQLSL
jgi:hypothetical protein